MIGAGFGFGVASLARLVAVVAIIALPASAPVQAQTPHVPDAQSTPQAGEDRDQAAPEHEAAELIGASVFAADGTEVGEVGAVTLSADGQISEVHVTIASSLGLGSRTVVLSHGTFVALRGAVVVDMTPEELNTLPSPASTRGVRS
jgi:sporulation protein YlmC with PRC-barrel domain